MEMDRRMRTLLLGVLLLAGCSSSTTPPVETPVTPQADQAAATPPAEPHPEPAPAAPKRAAVAKDKPQIATPPPSEQPKDAADTPTTPPAPEPTPVVQAPPAPSVPPQPTTSQVPIPEGTLIAVRTSDPIDSSTAKVGQTFRATLDVPLTVGDESLAPRGADVDLRLTHVESAGSLTGQSKVSLDLERIFVAGKFYTVASTVYEKQAESQTKQTAKRSGIGAGIGAVIGAIAGGGKGAAIGAGVGGGAGVGIEAAGKGPQVRIDSESRLDFRLQQPLEVTVETKPTASATSTKFNFASGPRMLTPRTTTQNSNDVEHDLSGKWRVTVNSPQESRTMAMTLTQTGDRLEGTLDNRGRTESLKGTVHGDSVTFSTSADSNEQAPALRFEGKLSNDHLEGTMSRSGGGYRGGRGGRGGRSSAQSVKWT